MPRRPGKRDPKRVPVWARQEMEQLRLDLTAARAEIEQLRVAHSVLFEYGGWFTIHGPGDGSYAPDGQYHLFFCDRTGTRAACSLRKGDMLLLGRKRQP